MAKDKSNEASTEVVVLKGKYLRHDGEKFRQNARLTLPESDAKRLVELGFVKAFAVLLQESQQVDNPVVSVTATEGLITPNLTPSTPANGAA